MTSVINGSSTAIVFKLYEDICRDLPPLDEEGLIIIKCAGVGGICVVVIIKK